MSLVVVTGMGARTGTSFVMNAARTAGLQITGEQFPPKTIPQHNPNGYWELTKPCKDMDNTIVKLWYPTLRYMSHSLISRILVLERRDRLAQLISTHKVYRDERLCYAVEPQLNLGYEEDLRHWLCGRDPSTVLHIYTEDINQEHDNIIQFLSGGL